MTAHAAGHASITVDFSVDQHNKPVSGAAFSIAKLLDHQEGKLYLTPEAEHLGVTKEQIEKDAAATAMFLQGKLSARMTLKTGADGIVTFDGLDEGVYLVWMSGREKEALEYKEAAPAIVSLPCWDKGSLMYSQTIYPKTSKNPGQGGEGNHSVKTGDTANAAFWLCLLALAFMTAWMILAGKRRFLGENKV